jgi:hypothetical protein
MIIIWNPSCVCTFSLHFRSVQQYFQS